MKKILLISLLSLFVFGCDNTQKKSATVLTVDEVLEKAADMIDKEVTVKGTVMHVCKRSGARCFIMGSTEDFKIRIEAGDKIGAFKNEQMGTDITVKGILKSAEIKHKKEEEHKHKEGEHKDHKHKEGEHKDHKHKEGEHKDHKHKEGEHKDHKHKEGDHKEGDHKESEEHHHLDEGKAKKVYFIEGLELIEE